MRIGSITVDGMSVGIVNIAFTPEDGDKDAPNFGGEAGQIPQALGSPDSATGGDGGDGGEHHAGAPHAPAHHAAHQNQHHFVGHEPHPAEGHHGGGHHHWVGHHHPADKSGGDQGQRNYVSSGTLKERRARFEKELHDNPALRTKLKRIMANEQGSNPAGTQAIAESAMNRAAVRGTSLADQLHWHHGRNGYYQTGSMGRGAVENPKTNSMLEKGINAALGGSDLARGATDNSSGSLARNEAATGKFITRQKINGETFSRPGTAEPGLVSKWKNWNAAINQNPNVVTPKANQEASIAPEPNYSGAHRSVNYMKGPPPSGSDMEKVTTAGGHAFRVNPKSAAALKGFVEDLEKSGAPINNVGGYNRRQIANSNRWSQHAYGNAIDINQSSRNVTSKGFEDWRKTHNSELRSAMAKHNIVSGGDWSNPDWGHFEWGGPGNSDTAKK